MHAAPQLGDYAIIQKNAFESKLGMNTFSLIISVENNHIFSSKRW